MTKDFERWYERYGTYNSDYTGQIPAHVAAEIKRVAWRAWKARAKKAEQDARRYRWLRDQWFIWGAEFPWDGLDLVRALLRKELWIEESKEHLDEAIDAAIDTSESDPAGSPSQPEPPQ